MNVSTGNMLKLASRRIIKRIHQAVPQTAAGGAGRAEVIKTRLDLLDKIYSNVRSVEQQMPVISTINEMTRYALNASASSLFLCDEEDNTLINKFTDCPLGKQFNQLQMEKELGIAGQVIQNGQPLIVNDIDKDERFNKYKDEVDGIVARSVICAPLIVQNTVVGVIEALNKLDGNDFNEQDLQTLAGLSAGAALTIENVRLNERLLYSYKRTIQKLVSLADSRETTESKHSRRVAKYALIGANQLSLSEEEQQTIEYAAVLHDIGLLSVPQSILKKREALTKEDWSIIRKHPVIGYNLLRGIPSLDQVSKLILYHHERLDGRGYPCGLTGETIPMGARLLSVADAFDSMTVRHSYRAASSAKDAMKELGKCSGTQFCPDAVKAFCLGYIKSHSLGRSTANRETSSEYWRNKSGDSAIWPISFNQNSTLRKGAPQ
jgi:HD-GYP domain-containing protein (c-di-GMP phosphodiesterase class II)